VQGGDAPCAVGGEMLGCAGLGVLMTAPWGGRAGWEGKVSEDLL